MIWSNIAIFAAAIMSALITTAFATAQLGLTFVRIHTEIRIAAPPEAVWAVIAEFDAYPEWNPLMTEVNGQVGVGNRLDWSSRINGADRTYDGRVVKSDMPHELAWIGPDARFPRALFWGHHRLIIEPTDDGETRFVNSEQFGGVASIAVARFLRRDVAAAYVQMNNAVRQRAETGGQR